MNDFDSFYISCLLLCIGFILGSYGLYRSKRKVNLKKVYWIIGWNLWLIICLTVIVFVSGETYYRFFVDTTDSFSINKVSQRWMKRHAQLNDGNMRDNIEYFNRIQKGKRRITIIGDSFTEGHGIKDVNDRFGNILRARHPETEIHVIAYSGSNTVSQLKNMQKMKEAGYEFDIVILAYCLNDIDFFVEETKAIYERIHRFNENLGFLATNSYFINTMAFQLFALQDEDFMNYSNFVLESYSNKAWERQKNALRKFKSFVLNENGQFLVLTFPFLQQAMEEYAFKEVHESIDKFWKSQRIINLDLLDTYAPYLGEELTVNKFDAHPNETAHRMAADVIDGYFSGGASMH